MRDPKHFLTELSIPDHYRARLSDYLIKIKWGSHVKILVVVDEEISTSPGVGFGIHRVIELIRATTVGCMSFSVDIALRSGGSPTIVPAPGPFDPKYTGFRFHMLDSDGTTPVVNRYAQIWCFGFKPDNFGGPDSNITQAGAFPASDPELATLATWMNDRKGGMFATGDHDYLGASMCHRIPRVRTMRRWTNADGVPPIGTPDRIDTLRLGTEPLSNTPHQGDTVPQPIQWVAWQSVWISWFKRKARPHPVLCHPTLGPIDVMPDHAHEGLCFDNPDVNLGGSFNFDGAGNKPEYPTVSGLQPRPQIIAYGSTLGGPPIVFGKGPQPYRPKFPMISVYDGHLASVGRVAVDSTWHHWMNVNIDNIASAGGNDWEKIKRYYINLAVWLSPPGYSTKCLIDYLVLSHFGYAGLQEYSPRLGHVELGEVARHLIEWRYWGPCWVTQFIFDLLLEVDIKLRHRLMERYLLPIEIKPSKGPRPFPDPCLTCPPLELLENAVLGGIISETMKPAAEMRRKLSSEKNNDRGIDLETLHKNAYAGVKRGLTEFGKLWQGSLEQAHELFQQLK